MHGPTCIFWANLTPFFLQWSERRALAEKRLTAMQKAKRTAGRLHFSVRALRGA